MCSAIPLLLFLAPRWRCSVCIQRLNTVSAQPNMLPSHINYVTHIKQDRVSRQLKIWHLQSMRAFFFHALHAARHLLYCHAGRSAPSCSYPAPYFRSLRRPMHRTRSLLLVLGVKKSFAFQPNNVCICLLGVKKVPLWRLQLKFIDSSFFLTLRWWTFHGRKGKVLPIPP